MDTSRLRTLIVVPCFNEADRLDPSAMTAFVDADDGVGLVPVDDGSTDDTWSRLGALAEDRPEHVFPLRLESNRGKAEAVRRGLLSALDRNPDYVGYWDADLSTPLEAVTDFERVMAERPEVQIVLGSRVALVGRDIERSKLRHYVGRIFATFAANTLKLRIYDTQCGAKLLRCTPPLGELLAEPFVSTWAFDVELLARILVRRASTAEADAQLWELPLARWRDVAGSKVGALDLPRSLIELMRIRRAYPGLGKRDSGVPSKSRPLA